MLDIHETQANHFDMTVSGEVTENDIRSAVSILEPALKTDKPVHILTDLTNWESMTLDALSADIKAGVRLMHDLNTPIRMAVITDRDWITKVMEFESLLLPKAEMKSFTPAERDQAKTWLH